MPFRCIAWLVAFALLAGLNTVLASGPIRADSYGDWSAAAPRAELKPEFYIDDQDGPKETLSLIIKMGDQEGLQGRWRRTFSIEGGRHYRFHALRKAVNVPLPRRSVLVKITWQDDHGDRVPNDHPTNPDYFGNAISMARPEYPMDRETPTGDWVQVTDTYRTPSRAAQAVVELIFRWGPPQSVVRWNEVKFEPVSAPEQRIVRLASVHFRPRSEARTPEANRRLYSPFIEQAAEAGADLVVLGETLTFYGTGRSYADCAEPIPGPSTDYFGTLARRHDLYIVAGLLEREGHLVYNVAVLMGPDGSVVGKYRKTCLPRGEADGGITPGDSYPVFDTRFGKVGMMVCYDGFFPEVARQLAINGAEVIAFPVWGCNPDLAAARACENHVYVVSSTYTDHEDHWIKTAVFDHEGRMIERAHEWGEVVIAEVDLNERRHWHGLGDFKARIDRGRPEWKVEGSRR